MNLNKINTYLNNYLFYSKFKFYSIYNSIYYSIFTIQPPVLKRQNACINLNDEKFKKVFQKSYIVVPVVIYLCMYQTNYYIY